MSRSLSRISSRTTGNATSSRRVNYPGTGNYSQFIYDGLKRNAEIAEYTSGSLISTKLFVWAADELRLSQPCEARNALGTQTDRYYALGESISGANYYFTRTHEGLEPSKALSFLQKSRKYPPFDPAPNGSIREMTNSSGIIQSQISFDPYGRSTQIQGSLSPDFQFGGYYFHAPSGLSLTKFRLYSPKLGRLLNRDPAMEIAGFNLFAYVGNAPISLIDPTGAGWWDKIALCLTSCGVTDGSPCWKCLQDSGGEPFTVAYCLSHACWQYAKCLANCLNPFKPSKCDSPPPDDPTSTIAKASK